MVMYSNSHSSSFMKQARTWFVGIGLVVILGLTFLFLQTMYKKSAPLHESVSFLWPTVTPWECVGGCGAGGSGGGGGDAIRWIGQGVSGGYCELEVLPRFAFGKNFRVVSIAPHFSYKPFWDMRIGVTIPFSSKMGAVQYLNIQPENTRVTGGMGDIAFDFSKTFGAQGQYSLSLSLGVPTGQYDIRRSVEQNFLPSSLQMGSGLYSSSIGLGYTKDVNKGLWLFDASLSAPFAMHLLSGQNEFVGAGKYYEKYKDKKDNKRFYYRFKPYGENDLGDYTPPSVSASAFYAYRGEEKLVHSIGMQFSMPLGVAWMHSEKSGLYNPIPDPDHKSWQMQFAYGVEFIRDNYPVFVGICMPISAQSPAARNDPKLIENPYDPSPMKKLSPPDFKNMFQQWTVAIGTKRALF